MSDDSEYIGTAKMQSDGTLVLDLRAEDGEGTVGHGRLTYPPNDPHYEEVLQHLGGMKPGEEKPVRPWEDA